MAPRGTGSEDWLYRELASLRELVTTQHQRMQAEMAAGFEGVRRDMKEHQAFDDETRRMVEGVITEQRVKEKLALQKTTWVALAVSAASTVFWSYLAKWVGLTK